MNCKVRFKSRLFKFCCIDIYDDLDSGPCIRAPVVADLPDIVPRPYGNKKVAILKNEISGPVSHSSYSSHEQRMSRRYKVKAAERRDNRYPQGFNDIEKQFLCSGNPYPLPGKQNGAF